VERGAKKRRGEGEKEIKRFRNRCQRLKKRGDLGWGEKFPEVNKHGGGTLGRAQRVGEKEVIPCGLRKTRFLSFTKGKP